MGRWHVWDSCFSRASDGMAVFSERGNRDQWHFDPHLHPRLGWPGLQGACLPPPRAETPRFQLPGVSARAPVWTPLGFTDIPRGPGKAIELPPPPPRAISSGRKRSLCFAKLGRRGGPSPAWLPGAQAPGPVRVSLGRRQFPSAAPGHRGPFPHGFSPSLVLSLKTTESVCV